MAKFNVAFFDANDVLKDKAAGFSDHDAANASAMDKLIRSPGYDYALIENESGHAVSRVQTISRTAFR